MKDYNHFRNRFSAISKIRSFIYLLMYFKRFIVLVITIIIFNISNSVSIYSEKFQGPISTKEKRIKDYKQELNETNLELPEEYHLFFQELRGNYAIFYDLDGQTVHFQYRRNKWDRDAIESVHNLLSGRSYKVSGEFLGMYYYPTVQESRNSILPLFIAKKDLDLKTKKDRNAIPIYKLKVYDESYSDAILMQTPDQ